MKNSIIKTNDNNFLKTAITLNSVQNNLNDIVKNEPQNMVSFKRYF